jgi:hypothetical protein
MQSRMLEDDTETPTEQCGSALASVIDADAMPRGIAARANRAPTVRHGALYMLELEGV